MTGAQWVCGCGDEAVTSTDDAAIAGAAAHYLWHRGMGHYARPARAYGAAGEALASVADATAAQVLWARHGTRYSAEGCVWDRGNVFSLCYCGCREYEEGRPPGWRFAALA